jgi:hypothetical protein
MDYQSAVERVIADPRYLKNIEFGEPRSGHPEGKIKNHIAHLEINLEQLKHRLPDDETYWKLKFLIHVHDTFKPDATQTGTSPDKPYSHASLARAFASEFVTDQDILNIIQYHDEDYALWKYFQRTGQYDEERLEILLNTIQDWDLYLAFIIVDGYTEGKVLEKLPWFINWVRQYKSTQVDETWTHLKPLEL